MVRAYGLSTGHFVAPALTPLPSGIARLALLYPPHLENVRRITVGELSQYSDQPAGAQQETLLANEGMNVNTWIPYVPSAGAIAVARLFRSSPLVTLYIARFANLFVYVALTCVALRLLPFGKLVLFTIGLMPMTIHQAASLSWDSITFGLSFVFCALIVRYASLDQDALRPRDFLVLFVMVVITSLCKVDFALLPLLVLIPTSKFLSRQRRIGFLLACAAVALAATGIWQYVNRDNFAIFRQAMKWQYHTNFPDNVWYLYYQSGYFINALGRSIVETGAGHLTELVGVFGWLYVKLSGWVVLMYVSMLVGAALTTLSELRLTWLQRSMFFGVAILGSAGCVLAMWLQTPDWYIQSAILHNTGTLYGIQGRHFIPFVLPALFALSNSKFRARSPWLIPFYAVLIVAVNIYGIISIQRAYY